ncbi:MAG TPA: ADP-ribosylglycohydrolase family protein [Ruminiclostridium sp.]
MLREQRYMKTADYLIFELKQSADEGKDVSGYKEEVERIIALDRQNPERELLACKLFKEIINIPAKVDYPYVEPSDLEGIRAQRSEGYRKKELTLSRDEIYNKVYGAWLGRCVGCLLGQPIEGWMRDRIYGLLKDTDNYPINRYLSSEIPEEIIKKYDIQPNGSKFHDGIVKHWINNTKNMPEDDDTNYTVIGLKILERYGENFTPDDVAETWLMNLPVLHLATAERVAYRNFVACIFPPESAITDNIFREWIGAQIRADFFGYINMANPERAAEMAWRDASISHIKNGIYGEMFVAAMLAHAAISDDIEEIIKIGLSEIPKNCRLEKAIKEVVEWYESGVTWQQAIDKIHVIYDETNKYDWCHTISNAMIVCIGLLYGGHDFEKTVAIAVMGALDTDCNGATVGSIVGMILGAKALPEKWIDPLNDKIKSGVDGFGLVNISELAKRTAVFIK